MTTTNNQSEQQAKTPFYLTAENQPAPSGYLCITDDGVLVIEFIENRPTIRIEQAQAAKAVDFVSDSSFRVVSPNAEEADIHIYLTPDGSGRYAIYGIREWTGVDGTELRAIRKRAFLARFDSTGAKLVVIWQLTLPYILFGSTYILHAIFDKESLPDVSYFVDSWQRLALSPIVIIHYVLLLVPGLAILFYNRMWSLRVMFNMTSLLALIVIAYCLIQPQWLPLPQANTPLVLQEHWTVFLPYLLLLVIPSYYYVIVERRL